MLYRFPIRRRDEAWIRVNATNATYRHVDLTPLRKEVFSIFDGEGFGELYDRRADLYTEDSASAPKRRKLVGRLEHIIKSGFPRVVAYCDGQQLVDEKIKPYTMNEAIFSQMQANFLLQREGQPKDMWSSLYSLASGSDYFFDSPAQSEVDFHMRMREGSRNSRIASNSLPIPEREYGVPAFYLTLQWLRADNANFSFDPELVKQIAEYERHWLKNAADSQAIERSVAFFKSVRWGHSWPP